MAQKLDASLALEGQFSAEGLAAMSADSGSLTMELAKSLVENIDFGDAERVWEKLGSERAEPAAALADKDGCLLPCAGRMPTRDRCQACPAGAEDRPGAAARPLPIGISRPAVVRAPSWSGCVFHGRPTSGRSLSLISSWSKR